MNKRYRATAIVVAVIATSCSGKLLVKSTQASPNGATEAVWVRMVTPSALGHIEDRVYVKEKRLTALNPSDVVFRMVGWPMVELSWISDSRLVINYDRYENETVDVRVEGHGSITIEYKEMLKTGIRPGNPRPGMGP